MTTRCTLVETQWMLVQGEQTFNLTSRSFLDFGNESLLSRFARYIGSYQQMTFQRFHKFIVIIHSTSKSWDRRFSLLISFLCICKRGWREWIHHIGLIPRIIPLMLFLDMVTWDEIAGNLEQSPFTSFINELDYCSSSQFHKNIHATNE